MWVVQNPLRYHWVKPAAFSFRSFNSISGKLKRNSPISSCWKFSNLFFNPSVPLTDLASKSFRKQKKEVAFNCENIEARLEEGSLIQAKFYEVVRGLAYVINPYDGHRIFIYHDNCNNALNEDIVLVELLPIGKWKLTGIENFESPEKDSSDNEIISDVIQSTVESSVLDSPVPSPSFEAIDASESPVLVDQTSSTSIEFKKTWFYNIKQVLDNSQHITDNTLLSIIKSLDLSSVPSASCPLPYPNLIRTGVVKKVLKSNPANRKLLGCLAFYPNNLDRGSKASIVLPMQKNFSCVLLPYSSDHPLVQIDPSTVPSDALKNHQIGLKNSYVCRVTHWSKSSKYPYGVIEKNLGSLNELEKATENILLEHGIVDEQFTSEELQGLPTSPQEFKIPETEYEKRKDFRSHCVVTIDPEHAKDFDDALHITRLNNGLYEVGIHIADVSYFVYPNSPLDKRAADRTTSVYLVQKVIPMLPPILSQHLCSLVPNEDRLAFSILLTVKENGEIVNEWFGRSVIRSRCRLTYDEAWSIIQMTQSNSSIENKSSLLDILPRPEAPFTFQDLQNCLRSLHLIAENLRSHRMENGALSLEKVELNFSFPKPLSEKEKCTEECSTTLWPQGFSVKVRNPAHYLVEEWMIVANQSIARFLFGNFIKRLKSFEIPVEINKNNQRWLGATLRNHPKPKEKKFNQLAQLAKSNNIEFDATNSASLSCSIKKLADGIAEKESFNKSCLLNLMCSLAYMTYIRLSVALYFNLDSMYNILIKRYTKESLLENISYDDHFLRILSFDPQSIMGQNNKTILNYTWHYGLSIPLYTHFTSPIRRYADLIVHRQMARILECDDTIHSGLQTCFARNNDFAQQYLKNHEIDLQVTWCNVRRLKARRAGEASQRLFLTACVRDYGPFYESGTVMELSNNKIKILIASFGLVIETEIKNFLKNVFTWKRNPVVQTNNSDKALSSDNGVTSENSHSITITWHNSKDTTVKNSKQSEISLLSILPCRVFCLENTLVPLVELVNSDHVSNQDIQ
ncbi:unnamed protein product [Schistosoma turkestanicum]|nr:unnamed protein product [Schistosoma turkestanicum]